MFERLPFACPQCKVRTAIAAASYPEAGGMNPCPSCGVTVRFPPLANVLKMLEMSAPGLAVQPAATVPQAGTAPPERPKVYFRVMDPQGVERRLERLEMRDGIRRKEILAETPVAADGRDEWLSAGKVRELERYFALAAQQGRPERRRVPLEAKCHKHPYAAAAFICVECGFLCEFDVTRKTFSGTEVVSCMDDKGFCRPVERRREVETLANRAVAALTYPFKGTGPVHLAIFAFLTFLGSLWNFFPPMTWLLAVFAFLALTYQLEIVRESARGETEVPSWPEGADYFEWIRRGGKALVVSIVCEAPIFLFNWWMMKRISLHAMGHSLAPAAVRGLPPVPGLPAPPVAAAPGMTPSAWLSALAPDIGLLVLGNFVLGLVALAYYPMAFACVAVWDTLLSSLNPVLLARAIKRVGTDYLLFCALTIPAVVVFAVSGAIALVIAILSWRLDSAVLLFGVPVVLAIVEAAILFWLLHLLGWMVYRHIEDLGWE